jgi:hypothetical protein
MPYNRQHSGTQSDEISEAAIAGLALHWHNNRTVASLHPLIRPDPNLGADQADHWNSVLALGDAGHHRLASFVLAARVACHRCNDRVSQKMQAKLMLEKVYRIPTVPPGKARGVRPALQGTGPQRGPALPDWEIPPKCHAKSSSPSRGNAIAPADLWQKRALGTGTPNGSPRRDHTLETAAQGRARGPQKEARRGGNWPRIHLPTTRGREIRPSTDSAAGDGAQRRGPSSNREPKRRSRCSRQLAATPKSPGARRPRKLDYGSSTVRPHSESRIQAKAPRPSQPSLTSRAQRWPTAPRTR